MVSEVFIEKTLLTDTQNPHLTLLDFPMAPPPNPAYFTPDVLSYPLNINSHPIFPSAELTETQIELPAATSFQNTIPLKLADQDFSLSARSETARA